MYLYKNKYSINLSFYLQHTHKNVGGKYDSVQIFTSIKFWPEWFCTYIKDFIVAWKTMSAVDWQTDVWLTANWINRVEHNMSINLCKYRRPY